MQKILFACILFIPARWDSANTFVLQLSPFVSLSLGAGFNMLLLCDLPANAAAVKQGPSYTLGININF